MKYKKQILFLVLVSCFLFSWANLMSPSSFIIRNSPSQLGTLADPISIIGNTELAAAASSGNGSLATPYIIKNKNINASGLAENGISIRNTNKYFILRNCSVTDASYRGIYLFNVTNARIDNNTVKYSAYGVWSASSYNNVLTHNTANNNDNNGFYLMDSNDTYLTDNTANFNYWEGILAVTCINITLTGNTANYNMDGIAISNSYNNTLIGNTATNNGDGIYLYESNYNILTGNIATNNSYGIYLFYSNFTTVVGNTLTGNFRCIHEYGGVHNIVENNDCGTTIPSYAWSSIILGLMIIILVGVGIKKKLERHHVLKNIF